jgi:hypothetical protein
VRTISWLDASLSQQSAIGCQNCQAATLEIRIVGYEDKIFAPAKVCNYLVVEIGISGSELREQAINVNDLKSQIGTHALAHDPPRVVGDFRCGLPESRTPTPFLEFGGLGGRRKLFIQVSGVPVYEF